MSIKVTFDFLSKDFSVVKSIQHYVEVIPQTGDYVEFNFDDEEHSGTVSRVRHFYNEFRGTEIRISVVAS